MQSRICESGLNDMIASFDRIQFKFPPRRFPYATPQAPLQFPGLESQQHVQNESELLQNLFYIRAPDEVWNLDFPGEDVQALSARLLPHMNESQTGKTSKAPFPLYAQPTHRFPKDINCIDQQ